MPVPPGSILYVRVHMNEELPGALQPRWAFFSEVLIAQIASKKEKNAPLADQISFQYSHCKYPTSLCPAGTIHTDLLEVNMGKLWPTQSRMTELNLKERDH